MPKSLWKSTGLARHLDNKKEEWVEPASTERDFHGFGATVEKAQFQVEHPTTY